MSTIYIDKEGYHIPKDKWLNLNYDDKYCLHKIEAIGTRLFLLHWIGLEEVWWTFEEIDILEKKVIDWDWWPFSVEKKTTQLDLENQFNSITKEYKNQNKNLVQDEKIKSDLTNFKLPEVHIGNTGTLINTDTFEKTYICPLCNAGMVTKVGKFGKFYSCGNWSVTKCPATLNALGEQSRKTKEIVKQKKKQEALKLLKKNNPLIKLEVVKSKPKPLVSSTVGNYNVAIGYTQPAIPYVEFTEQLMKNITEDVEKVLEQAYLETKVPIEQLIEETPKKKIVNKKTNKKKFDPEDLDDRFAGIAKNKIEEKEDDNGSN
jgi:ssDNA-binding Zn-finger/Zn-ribbon topoisomerase 1